MSDIRNKLYFVSDAHLGSGDDSRERELSLCRLLDSMKTDAKRLVLLGDMFDFWFSYKHVVPRGHVRLLGKLAELADAGVEIHYYIGNHDMWLFDYLEKEIGVVMHTEPDIMEFDGRRFLIGHGDGLGGFDPGYDHLKKIFRNRACQRLFALLPPRLTFPIAQRWSDSNKLRHQREGLQHYLGDDREGIVIYMKERMQHDQFDYAVFGHRHTPLDMEISTQAIKHSGNQAIKYINTGDWLDHRSYAVYAEGNIKLVEDCTGKDDN